MQEKKLIFSSTVDSIESLSGKISSKKKILLEKKNAELIQQKHKNYKKKITKERKLF